MTQHINMIYTDRLIKVSGIQGYEKYLKRKRKDVEEIKKIRNLDE